MKKTLVFLAIIIIVMCSLKEESIVIPDKAIRFRVIADNSTIESQIEKNKVSNHMIEYLNNINNNVQKDEIMNNLINNYNNIDKEINSYLKDNNINSQYKLNIGKNYFPQKYYQGIKYDANNYDSIVITLGEGKGLNWWCIIYPPLCLIDDESVHYTTLAQEMLNKYNA